MSSDADGWNLNNAVFLGDTSKPAPIEFPTAFIRFQKAKRPANTRLTDEQAAHLAGFKRKGHWEDRPWTPEQAEQVAEAHRLVDAMEDNPYVLIDGYDGRPYVQEPPTRVWVFDETVEEWLCRFRHEGESFRRPTRE